MSGKKIGIVGATGLVGRTALTVLAERGFEVENIRCFASAASAGKVVETALEGSKASSFRVKVEELNPDIFDTLDIAIFSAGSAVSRHFAPIAAQKGCVVIDNSSAWRMDSSVPLVVPEVNPHHLTWHKGIIANPNCSTIQMVCVLDAINKVYPLDKVIVSTYQSVSGAGAKGVAALHDEITHENGRSSHSPFREQAAWNAFFHDFSGSGGTTEEEEKMLRETKKIMESDFALAVTCVRVPTLGGHAESVVLFGEEPLDAQAITKLLSSAPGVIVTDEYDQYAYPTPQKVQNKDGVYVGRIRNEPQIAGAVSLWIVADNIRKGAATNAVQIAELL